MRDSPDDPAVDDCDGGGLLIVGSPRLANVIVNMNFATGFGAGIAWFHGSAFLDDVDIERNIAANETTLRGRLPEFEDSLMRANRVLRLENVSEVTRIDGFTIHDASAPSPSCSASFTIGATICDGNCILDSSSPTLASLRIVANQMENRGYGGGIAHFDGALHLENVVFDRNTAAAGGALRTFKPSAVYITNTKMISNTAPTGGGVSISNPRGVVFMRSLVVEGNSVLDGGGIILIDAPD